MPLDPESGLPSLGTVYFPWSIKTDFHAYGFRDWGRLYPDLFDDRDRSFESQLSTTGHFADWMAGVVVFRTLGWSNIQSKYHHDHARKNEILDRLAGDKLRGWINARRKELRRTEGVGPGCPDLVAFNGVDWCFVEAKFQDGFKPYQPRWFKELRNHTCHLIYLLQLRELTTGTVLPPDTIEGFPERPISPGFTLRIQSFAATLGSEAR